MKATTTSTQQILDAIQRGQLPPAETEARLLAIIQEESERADREADASLISACLNLLERLHHESGAAAERPTSQRMKKIALRVAGIAAALVLLITGFTLLGYRAGEPSQEASGHSAHGLSLDMIATAMAEGDSDEPVIVHDISQLDSLLGLQLQLPERLGGEWTAAQGQIRYLPEYIRIEVLYAHAASPDKDVVCVISLFTETDNLYISFEQTGSGQAIFADGRSMYISAVAADNPKNGRIAVYWQESCMSLRLSGRITASEAVGLMVELSAPR